MLWPTGIPPLKVSVETRILQMAAVPCRHRLQALGPSRGTRSLPRLLKEETARTVGVDTGIVYHDMMVYHRNCHVARIDNSGHLYVSRAGIGETGRGHKVWHRVIGLRRREDPAANLLQTGRPLNDTHGHVIIECIWVRRDSEHLELPD